MWALANKLPLRPRHQRTGTIVLTRIYGTRVIFPFTIITHEIPSAVAGIPVNAVDADTAVLARLGQALIDVDLAVLSCKSILSFQRRVPKRVIRVQIKEAEKYKLRPEMEDLPCGNYKKKIQIRQGAIFKYIIKRDIGNVCVTQIHTEHRGIPYKTHTMHRQTQRTRGEDGKIGGAITGISWQALAVIAVELIDADTAVTTGIAGTLVHVDGALVPGPSWLAGAIIAARLYRQ